MINQMCYAASPCGIYNTLIINSKHVCSSTLHKRSDSKKGDIISRSIE